VKKADDSYTRECNWDDPADVKRYRAEWLQVCRAQVPGASEWDNRKKRDHWRIKKFRENLVDKEKNREYARAYLEANRDRIRERDRAYREANQKKIRERARAYNEANQKKIRERARAYHEANGEQIRERGRAYWATKKRAQQAANFTKTLQALAGMDALADAVEEQINNQQGSEE
jgi:hypothetical protein